LRRGWWRDWGRRGPASASGKLESLLLQLFIFNRFSYPAPRTFIRFRLVPRVAYNCDLIRERVLFKKLWLLFRLVGLTLEFKLVFRIGRIRTVCFWASRIRIR
jgi:hypothetical protein